MLRFVLFPALLTLACCAGTPKPDEEELPSDSDDPTPIDTDDPVDDDRFACPTRIDEAILSCLADLQQDPEQGGFLIDLLLACADPEPVASTYDAYCAEVPDDPICGLAFQSFVEVVLPECVARAQEVAFAEVCLLPSAFVDVITSPGLALLERRTILVQGDASEIEQEQIVAASGEDDLTAALALAGDSGWQLLRLLEVGFDRELVFLTTTTDADGLLGAGFFVGTRFRIATVSQGAVSQCAVEIGVEGRVCAEATECDGRLCVGVVRNEEATAVLAEGVCANEPIEGAGDICAVDQDCGPGLICALFGTGAEEGACSPGWMRRSYRADLSAAALVPAGTLSLPIDVSGLATVPTVLSLDLVIELESESEVELTLFNPFGTASAVGTYSGDRVELFAEPVWAPGDESVNGRWVLEVEEVGGASGRVVEALVTIDSRWD